MRKCFIFFGGVGDEFCGAKYDDRAIIDRMMERRSRQHQAVDVRNRNANRHTLAECAQHAAGRAAVQIKDVAGAAIIRGDHVGLALHVESYVADKRGIENFVHNFAVIVAALGQAFDLGAIRWGELAHAVILMVHRRCASTKLA